MPPLRFLTYLAPSIPAELFALVASHVGKACGIETELTFETHISGPLAGDDEPFSDGRADVGFVCAPTYRWLHESHPDSVELLPLPVPLDPRSAGAPVYFADVVVRASSDITTFEQLRGKTWAFNDRNSKSGWFSMLGRVGDVSFFRDCVHSGSHLRSLTFVESGVADAAAIDSNVLRLRNRRSLRVLESWGPFAIQPVIIRSNVDPSLKRDVAAALLSLHDAHGDALQRFGFARFAPPDPSRYL